MLPARKDELLPDARRDLAYIAEVISTALAGTETADWDEVEREFADERNYLSISGALSPGEDAPTVRIEFGVQDEQVRHATGGLVARWLRDSARIAGLEIVQMDGKSCDVSPFAARLSTYAELPATVSETAMRDAD